MPDLTVIDSIEKAEKLDKRAVAAKTSKDEAELLIKEYERYLRSCATKFSLRNDSHQREELFEIAMIAFYEAIRNYDINKGHFFPYANKVVCGRIIDEIRKNYKHDGKTQPLEDADDDQDSSFSTAINETSIHIYEAELERQSLKDEIERFKSVLGDWGITLDALVTQSPKHKAKREECKEIASAIAKNLEIVQTIQLKHYFPIKPISELTKIPPKKLERSRMFILALILIKIGDYNYLSDYIK